MTDRKSIIKRYVFSGWFYLDFLSISVSTFDFLALETIAQGLNARANAQLPASGSSSTQAFKSLRVLRALRLIKLIRLVRASRILKRWEVRVAINYSLLEIVTLIGKIMLSCHIFAWCAAANLVHLFCCPCLAGALKSSIASSHLAPCTVSGLCKLASRTQNWARGWQLTTTATRAVSSMRSHAPVPTTWTKCNLTQRLTMPASRVVPSTQPPYIGQS